MMNGRYAQLLEECPLVITGMGAVSSAGTTVQALWEASVRGESLADILQFKEHCATYAGCSVPKAGTALGSVPLLRKSDRSACLGVEAALQAWKMAGGASRRFPRERVAVFAGTSRGPVGKLLESAGRARSDRMFPSAAASCTLASLSGLVAASIGAEGPALTVSAACASAAAAIALGAEQLLLGKADAVLAGGAEAPLHPLVLAQLGAAGVLGQAGDAKQICRPFDLHRTGTVLGEGAAFLVIETEGAARERGAAILARLSGWAVGAESGERTGISEDSAALVRVMNQALRVARVEPGEIGYINAHGTGTVLNDRQETVACRRVFGVNMPPCSSTKPVTGHCMGAAAALEAVVCLEALRYGVLPPTANWQAADPDCALDIISGQARTKAVAHVMSNSSGFWGNNASLIFSRV